MKEIKLNQCANIPSSAPFPSLSIQFTYTLYHSLWEATWYQITPAMPALNCH